jgi:hypothetical protein
MKRLFAYSFLLSVSIFIAKGQDTDFSIENIKDIGLKVVEIETVNHEEPTCDFVEAPEGCMGMTSVNATKVPCRIIITLLNDTLYDSGVYNNSVSGATIKINGNTSAYFAEDGNWPFKIKLQKKQDLLFRQDEQRFADKEWRLIKDAITMKTIVGLKISELLHFPWTPAYTPCNLFINGDYRGCYLLIESVERNKDCRIDVDKQSGYIIERDPYWWKENKFFATDYFASNQGYRWTWKYPDEDEVTDEQEEYIKQFICQAEQSIKDGTYENYIDIESFARWILANDILGCKDSGGTNLFVSKYDDNPTSLLQIPVLWDFDSNFQMEEGQFARCHNADYDFYFHDLFNNNNKAFIRAYQQLWTSIKPSFLNNITKYISSYIHSEEGIALELSKEIHNKRWEYANIIPMKEEAETIISWFSRHLNLLDKRISMLEETRIQTTEKKNEDHITYNLSGIQISNQKKGIMIKRQKKYLLTR